MTHPDPDMCETPEEFQSEMMEYVGYMERASDEAKYESFDQEGDVDGIDDKNRD